MSLKAMKNISGFLNVSNLDVATAVILIVILYFPKINTQTVHF
jgi:hypothetical protein